ADAARRREEISGRRDTLHPGELAGQGETRLGRSIDDVSKESDIGTLSPVLRRERRSEVGSHHRIAIRPHQTISTDRAVRAAGRVEALLDRIQAGAAFHVEAIRIHEAEPKYPCADGLAAVDPYVAPRERKRVERAQRTSACFAIAQTQCLISAAKA